MTSKFALSSDQVNQAVARVIKRNPVYADMLDFYGRLFVAQEECQRHMQIVPLQIPHDVRTVKAREKFPLVEVKDFAYDIAETARLLVTIGELAREANPKLAASAAALLNAVDTKLISTRLNIDGPSGR